MKRIFSVRTAVMRGRAMARPYKIPVLFYRSHITYLCIIAEGCEAAPKPSDDGFGLAEGMSAMRFSQGVMLCLHLCQARRAWPPRSTYDKSSAICIYARPDIRQTEGQAHRKFTRDGCLCLYEREERRARMDTPLAIKSNNLPINESLLACR